MLKSKFYIVLLTALFFFPVTACSAVVPKNTSRDLATDMVENGGFLVAGYTSLSYRANEKFTPASTLKILTSLVALERLGAEYRFSTMLYLDEDRNLYIKGGGDPFLTSEVVLEICHRLHKENPGITSINTLFLDDSCYDLKGQQVSIENSRNSYDAPNGALAVNFNALPVKVTKSGKVSSGEKETPALPLMRQRAQSLHLPPGIHRINIAWKAPQLDNSHNLTPALRYAGQLFTAQLARNGITVKNGICRRETPSTLGPLIIYKSEKTLQEMVRLLLQYSSNFIANQIFLQLSFERNRQLGRPATWEDSRKIVNSYAHKKLGISSRHFHLEEGSGLSLENRFTCTAFIHILKRFRPWAYLMKRKGEDLVKSGTMPQTGVFCFAGYFTRGEELVPFVLLLNQHRDSRCSLLQALHKRIL
ncbi:D-alanyl-D-alanine carboxypeptidase [Desulforhopalus vacuolatus]|uniref:D-alanyl-D-alanine carboxypeptidase/D-alanyl-D-alanine-endopeptidase n=1 Tax=Desulforhopalus vacuolatus TaxID=40414 RepID=UPI0019660E92|nr:D-alanyl-D-alanine carboxypeptidase [Desulforhopalus vacuolatus]MBM9519798.1 D-alanyl-D-alanine carboxypeptidase [Desulforhopalus vacuolatus]